MKVLSAIYLEDEEKFEPIKRLRKLWVRRPETKIKDRDHYNRRKSKINWSNTNEE